MLNQQRHWLLARDRVALLEDGLLVEYYEADPARQVRAGSIYAGIVRDVVPAITAAFVEIVPGERAFLQLEPQEELPRPGEQVLVQVTQEARPAKAPQVTREIKLPGRYLVLLPGSDHVGISKKISSEAQRETLRRVLEAEDTGAIVRSRATGVSADVLKAELRALRDRWDQMQADFGEQHKARLLYEEPPLPLRILRDRVEVGDQVTISDKELFDEARARNSDPRIEIGLSAEEQSIEQQLREAAARQVPLEGGGSIVIDRTEALTAIDVNSGSDTGATTLEQTAFRTNSLAAIEVARQIRLRNISGIIIVDFIEMRDQKHRDELMSAFSRELSRDPARIRLLPLDEFGLAKLTRKRQ